jgi:uncharacterized protein YndB with AHSA1/START domain
MPDLGSVERDGSNSIIRFERRFAHPVVRVWKAITDPAQAIKWWGALDIQCKPGGKAVVEWQNTDDQGNRAVMHGVITELDPPRVLEIEGDIHGTLRFVLTPDGNGTRLTFTSTLELPDEYRTKVLAGWHFHLDALAEALAGNAVDWPHWPKDAWERIHEEYVNRR